jgi:putative ABC transport system permease protein
VVLVVRTLDIDGAGRAVRAAVAAADPAVPIPRLQSSDVYLNERLKNVRVMTWLGAELGLLALLLAVAGLYAVMSYTVRRRTREIGIRLAMGALPSRVVALVLRQGFRLVAIGALMGSAVAIPLGFLSRSIFFGISPVDLQALLSTVGVLAPAALIASAVPAYRAAIVEPTVALRED